MVDVFFYYANNDGAIVNNDRGKIVNPRDEVRVNRNYYYKFFFFFFIIDGLLSQPCNKAVVFI